jgi:hypothetical protein
LPTAAREGGPERHDLLIRIEALRRVLVTAVQVTPHHVQVSLVGPLTGDEPHAVDCPGCALTNALVEANLGELHEAAVGNHPEPATAGDSKEGTCGSSSAGGGT